jgi:predicted transcriptional regulator
MTQRRAMRSLESEVLATLWAAERPLTPGDVLQELGGSLAYNTVQTILTRLWHKGAVERDASGRAHTYRPVMDDAGLAAHRMRAILDRRPDQEAVLMRFLGALTPEQETTLGALLRDRAAEDRS